MALTLPIVPTRIGPGMSVTVGNVGGPIAAGDFLLASLTITASGRLIITGRTLLLLPGTNFVTLGWNDQDGQVETGMHDGVVDGTAMTIVVQQYNAALALVDSVGPVGFGGWDPTSSPWALLAFVARRQDADLLELLDAVRFVFPATS